MAVVTCAFGPFVLDRASYRLLRHGQVVDLTPQLLDLLIHFIDHAGALLSKDELLDALWANANVTDNAVAHAVSDLRQILGDHPSAPEFIQTVARRGYRFIAPIEDAHAAPAAIPPKARRPTHGATTAIVVLDFTNVTTDSDTAWLSSGIAETVTTELRARGRLSVVDRWRVHDAMRQSDGSPGAIAARLGAARVVLGNVQHHASQVRVTARVLDASSGAAVADARADGPLDRIFDVQDVLVHQLLSGLGVAGAAGAPSSHGARDTGSLAAYKAFVEGWLHVESLDIRELPKAVVAFEHAIEADPRYAPAFAGLASAEFALYESTRTKLIPDKPRLDRAVAHARHAVQLDDRLAEAHATLALILVSTPRTEEAASAARTAVALEPGNWRHLFRLGHATWGDERLRGALSTLALYPDFAYSHFQMAMVHVARGHLAHAEAILRQGAAVQDQQLSGGGRYPALGLHWLLGLVRLAQDDPSDAVREFDREIAVADPNRLYGREYAVEAYCGRGFALRDMQRTEQALASFHEALKIDPEHVPARLAQRRVADGVGTDPAAVSARGECNDLLRILEQSRPADAAAMRAIQLAGERSSEEALIVLARCVSEAPPGFTGWLLPIHPALRSLHGHPTFQAVLTILAGRASEPVRT